MFKNKTILITGGTGSWGNELTTQLLSRFPDLKQILIFSRGEAAQVQMQRHFLDPRLSFVIGDVRDEEAIEDVMQIGVDYVFHLAALKHVPICEYYPKEAIKTNIKGTENIIRQATRYKVQKVIYVSTDKAVDPINLYGMTKGVCERLIIEANRHTQHTDFICIRAGNVLGTNGSLIPHIIEQLQTRNEVTLTDPLMTRFFLTLKTAIGLLFFAVKEGNGGELFVMNMPSFHIVDIVHLLISYYGDHNSKIKTIGIREGEKLHENLLSTLEIPRTYYVNEDYYVVYPQLEMERDRYHFWDSPEYQEYAPKIPALTSLNNLKDVLYLENLLKEGGFLQ